MIRTRARILLAAVAATAVIIASGTTPAAADATTADGHHRVVDGTRPDTAPPTDPNLPPAIVAPSDSLYFYGAFDEVPRLGEEPTRGTGCGSQGQIGDTIPDGLWAGYVTSLEVDAAGAGVVGIDLLCIFFGDSAQAVAAEQTANIISHDPDYLIVNNNPRARTLPTSPSLVLRESVVGDDGRCVEAAPGSFVEPGPRADRQAWIRVAGGAVTWILWGCGPFGTAPAALPAAFPNSSGPDVLGIWPYGEFWNVPQLGSEPVRGSGCGASGQLGDTIPDGLWAGYISYDPATDGFWVDVLCIFAGATAQAVLAEGTANVVSNEPHYLIVNNDEQRRQLANNLQVLVFGALDTNGRCVVGGWGIAGADERRITPQANDLFPTQAWIRIHEGAVTWIMWGCESGIGPGG